MLFTYAFCKTMCYPFLDSVFKEDNDKDDLRDFSLDLFGSKYHMLLKGGIQQQRGQNFAIFFTPSLLWGQFLYPHRGQKQRFFDPLPPHLVHVVIEWPLIKSI